jgi:DNA polymerase III epsilon subunit-like protein
MKKLLEEVAARCPGGKLPESYLVFDSETSGTNVARDRILQYGFAVVIRGDLVRCFNCMIHHGQDVKIEPGALRVHGIDHARMAREGARPEVLIPQILVMLETYRRQGLMFVGHNALSFDAPLVEAEARRYGIDFRFQPNEILDTGALVKAIQTGHYFAANDTLRSFAASVTATRNPGVYWSLDRYCFNAFELEKYGLRKDQAHDAAYDCRMTHYVLVELRRRAAEGAR